MHGGSLDPSRTIATFKKWRLCYPYSHFHLSWKINTFSQAKVRQDPSVNFKEKPQSDEEKKEEEEQEEEEIATALDSNDVSHEHVYINSCDHSKQGLETQIASETHNDPELDITDGCEPSKNVPDDIDKDVTDVIGSM